MKKLYFLIIIKTIFFIIIVVSFSACSEDKRRLYYETEGYGYVYYEDTKEPVPYAKLRVYFQFKYSPYSTYSTDDEIYFADETGFFKIKFLKRIEGNDVLSYHIIAPPKDYNSFYSTQIGYSRKDIKNIESKIIIMDTIWIIPLHF